MRITFINKLVLSAALTFAATLVGCGGGEKGAVDPIPTDLAAAETAAESGFDAALAANAAQVTTSRDALTRNWNVYKPRATGDGVPADAVASVDTAIAGLSTALSTTPTGTEAAAAFNRVSAPMSRLYAPYRPPVPTQLLDLDYFGREVLLDARRGNFTSAATHAQQLASIWTALRPNVLSSGGATQAKRMDDSVSQMQAAIGAANAGNLEAAARAEAEAVDVVEALFASLAGDHD